MLAQSGQKMTTDRTAIRRRLAIRGTAHRPPWGARKAGHGSIVAPLAATLAATVAVGAGYVLARSERERRRTQRRDRGHRLGLLPGEPLAHGLQRMALGQTELALAMLDGTRNGGAAPDERAVHETRKALKRLRALLRLLRDELGERSFSRESEALRQAARHLSGARDAAVMLATLDALIERHPRRLGRRRGVRQLRSRVAAESARMQRLTLADPTARAEVLGELSAFHWRVQAWSLPAGGSLELVDADLAHLYRQGRERHARAARGKGPRTLALHRWRKRVKDLRYAAEMLERRAPGGADGALRKLAARADDLGELLGEEHDLAVLAEHLSRARPGARRRGGRSGDAEATWHTGRRTREALLDLIAKRRRVLRRRALRKGERLYGERPRAFVRRVRRAYGAAAPTLS